MSRRYVRVAVPVPLHQTFTWSLPDGAYARPGQRVRVPFGRRRLVGVVVDGPHGDIPDGLEPKRIKPVDAVLDPAPVLSDSLMRLCGWMARYYHLPPGEAYLLPLPPAMTGGRRGAPRDHSYKQETVARWARDPGPDERIGHRMDSALSWLKGAGEATAREVRDATGADPDVLRRLASRGLVEVERRRVHRDPFAGMEVAPEDPPEPTRAQQAAIDTVARDLGDFRGFLLMGVTGSGKTEVYLRLIETVLERGEGAIVLVPEIALTPQLVGRFRSRFGDRIAVLHSGLDPAARHEQWLRIAAGELPVAIGARSALFAPVPNPGILIVDEEHEGSFKQDSSPRYHGRDLALVRGHIEGCPVVLGTATPSLESWANVERGKLARLDLEERVLDRPMPSVEVVDLREADRADDDGIFSTPLLEAIRANVERREQTILFLNRRGFASFVLCRTCGESMSCPSCSVTYTWHRGRARLVCHYCDRVQGLPPACPACGDDALQEVGFGTERVHAVLEALLPGARVARMDRDTTRGRALTRLLDAFRRHEIDVLVGTQMVAKGHDFPGVTLVGVLLADLGLRMPDFRGAERTFQLLTQIAGRAGRAEKPGRVMVQALKPDHYAIGYAVEHDAPGFLEHELRERRDRAFPPFAHMALFRVSGPDEPVTRTQAESLARHLRGLAGTLVQPDRAPRVTGPMPAPIERIKGRWRYQVELRGPGRGDLGRLLAQAMRDMDSAKIPSNIQIALDVDPQSFL
ncbi:MAG: replication restart helicase PriA [Myxococcota bacterium]